MSVLLLSVPHHTRGCQCGANQGVAAAMHPGQQLLVVLFKWQVHMMSWVRGPACAYYCAVWDCSLAPRSSLPLMCAVLLRLHVLLLRCCLLVLLHLLEQVLERP